MPYRHAQKPVSKMILDSINLSTLTSHLWYTYITLMFFLYCVYFFHLKKNWYSYLGSHECSWATFVLLNCHCYEYTILTLISPSFLRLVDLSPWHLSLSPALFILLVYFICYTFICYSFVVFLILLPLGVLWKQDFWLNFFYCIIFIILTIADFLQISNEWTAEKGRIEKSFWVQRSFGSALRLKINAEKLRKMDNDKEYVHLLIIFKSVIIRDRDVNWQPAAIGIDAHNLHWLKTQKLMSMKGHK